MATVKDVARLAEVSVATVSHVINETRFVSPALAERVREAMDRLGYTPNGTARSLRLRRTQTIGLIVPDNTNPFFAEFARLVEEEGFGAGYVTILGNATERPERELAYLEVLISKRVDGIILAATRHDGDVLADLVRRARVPLVVIDRDVRVPGADVVVCDNVMGGAAAARHLLELGHERFAIIGGPAGVVPAADRVRGFVRTLEAAGFPPTEDARVDSEFGYDSARDGVRELLRRGCRFTALFAANDVIAAGAIRELVEQGIRVPDDVSVVGFDDAPIAAMLSPALTTVRQPLAAMAATTVAVLLKRLKDSGATPPERHVLPTELVVRESTAVKAGRA